MKAKPPTLVPDGWTPERFIEHLERLAELCKDVNPEQARVNREQAEKIKRALADAAAVPR
jgi:hypothetical protein